MCEMCNGATLDEVRLRLADTIDRFGWALRGVGVEPGACGWVYTIGLLERFGHPELVMASAMAWGRMGGFLNALATEIKAGRHFDSESHAMVDNLDLRFADVHPRQFEFGVFNIWFDHYRALPELELTALQVVLPSQIFCPDHAEHQPRLDLDAHVLGGPINRAGRRAQRQLHRSPPPGVRRRRPRRE